MRKPLTEGRKDRAAKYAKHTAVELFGRRYGFESLFQNCTATCPGAWETCAFSGLLLDLGAYYRGSFGLRSGAVECSSAKCSSREASKRTRAVRLWRLWRKLRSAECMGIGSIN